MRFFFSALVFLVVFMPLVHAQSQMDENGIVAVVNDEPITAYDLFSRMRLIVFSAGKVPTPAQEQQLLAQTLQSLIQEKLTAQEALRLDLKLQEEEIKKGMDFIARQNKVPEDKLIPLLQENEIDPVTLRQKVSFDILWPRLVQKKAGNFGDVSSEEVDEELQNLASQKKEAPLPSRSEVMNILRVQKLEQVARKYLSDLKEDATIEIRIAPEQASSRSSSSANNS